MKKQFSSFISCFNNALASNYTSYRFSFNLDILHFLHFLFKNGFIARYFVDTSAKQVIVFFSFSKKRVSKIILASQKGQTFTFSSKSNRYSSFNLPGSIILRTNKGFCLGSHSNIGGQVVGWVYC